MNMRIDSPEETGVKRRQGQVGSCERTGKRSKKEKHLYLVLDDWSEGFTIHKIGDDAADDNSDLREPGVLRVFTPVAGRTMTFDAIGSNIFITTNPRCGQTPSLLFDTEAPGLAVGPPRPEPLLGGSYMSIATADRLYAFQHYIRDPQQFLQVMTWAPTDNDDPWAPRPTVDWGWQSVDSPWPFPNNEIIASYALHPHGHTIFFSAHSKHDNPNPKSIRTFSLDTTHRRWRAHGEWSLPFRGQGHYDTMLDAWVGLNKDGYICSCQVASTSQSQQPDCKVLQERLLCNPPSGRVPTLKATLTHVGNDAKFCLVECVWHDGDHDFGRDGCTLRITTFGLKYSHKGELQTMNRVTNSYTVSKHAALFSPVAFLM